tara:strand:- start:221 stop:901 length:681 start_codon:yes stop_codon:yes gene_type:complete
MGRIYVIINTSLDAAMKSAINYSLFCILGIIAGGCSPGVVRGVIQEVSIGRSCPAGYSRIYCRENTASITTCPTGYEVDGFGWCRQKPNEFVSEAGKSLDKQIKNISKYISRVTSRRKGAAGLDRYRKDYLKDAEETTLDKYQREQIEKKEQTALYNSLACRWTVFEVNKGGPWDRNMEYKYISGSQRCLNALISGKFSRIRNSSRNCLRVRKETGGYKDIWRCRI